MEQLLPRNAKGHFCNSRRSEEIFFGGGAGLMPITQVTEINLTWNHKSSFCHSKVVFAPRLPPGLRPWPPLGDFCPQTPWICSPGKISWLRHCPRLPLHSSLSIVVVISARLPRTEHSLFHAHVPLSATEASLSQDRACMEQFTGYYSERSPATDSLGNI